MRDEMDVIFIYSVEERTAVLEKVLLQWLLSRSARIALKLKA